MPLDSRRNQGPESSVPYMLYSSTEKKEFEVVKSEVLKNGIRKDGRKWDQHRKVYLKTSVVNQAKGSAYIEQNKTKVICSVFDPREIPRKSDYSVNGELYCEFKYAPFSYRTRRGHQQDSEEKEFSLILRRALEPAVCRHEFPNFQVDVYAFVLQDDGSAISAAITCASLALADASVPMYDLVASATLGVHDDIKLLDPSAEETLLCNTPPQKLRNHGSAISAAITCASLELADASVPMYDLDASATLGVHDDIKLLDPSAEETLLCNTPPQKLRNHGTIVFSYLASQQQISEYALTGAMDLECVNSAIDILTKASDDIYPLAQQCLVKSVARTLKKKKKSELKNGKRSEKVTSVSENGSVNN